MLDAYTALYVYIPQWLYRGPRSTHLDRARTQQIIIIFFFTKYTDDKWVLTTVGSQYERVLIGIHPQYVYTCISVHSNRRCLPVRALNAAASVSAAPSTAIIDPRGGRWARGGGARHAQLKYLLRVSEGKKTRMFSYIITI